MSEHVIYVDRFTLREGSLEEFKSYATAMAEFVEENEPEVLSFNYYVDQDGAGGTAVFVFSDAVALDLHLDLASSRFQEGLELLSATEIEVLGRPSERAAELAKSFGAALKTKLAGFNR